MGMSIDIKSLMEPGPDLVYGIRGSGEVWVWNRSEWAKGIGAYWLISFESEKKIKSYRDLEPSMKVYAGPHWKLVKSSGNLIFQSWNNDGWFPNEIMKQEYIEAYEEYRVFNLLR